MGGVTWLTLRGCGGGISMLEKGSQLRELSTVGELGTESYSGVGKWGVLTV